MSLSLDSNTNSGFQVKYLGSVSFIRKKRQPLKGIVSLQRPLLDLYTGARRRGEHHRSIHPLALTQQLEVWDYGLVVAEGTSRGETVVTKVITPLSNVVLWASVRFHARIIKKRVFGAAFVPLACSDGVLDHKSYICLASKQRFLVSLTHPSIFACIYRSVSSPTTFECHAFVCATAEDAIAVAALATLASSGRNGEFSIIPQPRRRIAASLDSGTDYYSPSDNRDEDDRIYGYRDSIATTTEEESNSYASVANKVTPSVGQRRYITGTSHFSKHTRRPYKKYLHHREARALIGKYKEPPRPLPLGSERWDVRPQRRREHFRQDAQQRSTSSYERDDVLQSVETPQQEPLYRHCSTMTDPPLRSIGDTEVLTETIDLSSETQSSISSSAIGSSRGGGWKPVLPVAEKAEEENNPPPLVKYTYFGFETYAKPTGNNKIFSNSAQTSGKDQNTANGKNQMGERKFKSHTNEKGGNIEGNGTGKITINVLYRPPSKASSRSSRIMPHGVRSFHKSGHVRNWSSLSQTSVSSSSSTFRGTSLPQPQRSSSNKVIRWSSDDRLPRRRGGGFFWSIKKMGIQSLTKAKHKTGKFLSTMKTKLMGPKRPSADGSEDSAYDTSEICLSPSGRQGDISPSRPTPARSVTRRQQSWSFHDLRTAGVERPTVRKGSNNTRRKHRRRQKNGPTSSSSDSGVEAAYHSDNSAKRTGSNLERQNNDNVTRVKVQHSMGAETFQKWSRTNMQDELGYIP